MSRTNQARSGYPPGEVIRMGIGGSLFLIAVGAILAWAVHTTVSGIDINTIGVILMVVGILGLVLSMLFWSSFAPFRRTTGVTEERVVRDREVI